MFYIIKSDKINELKDGRSVIYLSEILEINYANLSLILNGAKCKSILAMCLISIKEQIPINSTKMNDYLDYYFEKVT